jgi:hypothetical protein
MAFNTPENKRAIVANIAAYKDAGAGASDS